MSEASDGWYMRARGRILGPFTLTQLLSLRDRGQLSQFHEVSKDRRSWIAAAQVAEIFAGTVGFGAAGASSESDQPIYAVVEDTDTGSRVGTVEAAPGWFYAQGSSQNGPVLLVELQRMIDSGVIGPTTLVWRSGLPNWLPAHQAPELRPPGSAVTLPGSSVGPWPQQVQVSLNQPFAHYAPRTSGLAVASLVLGILGLCGIGSLLATIFGAVAINQISRSNGTLAGKGMAIAGLVLGIVGLSALVLMFSFGYLNMLLHLLQVRP
jgi:hypothetical protein